MPLDVVPESTSLSLSLRRASGWRWPLRACVGRPNARERSEAVLNSDPNPRNP